MSRHCLLKCVLNSHAPIALPHSVEIIVGRAKVTKIKDQSCSRKQISLTADCEECLVEVKQLGANPSGLDGFALKKDSVYKVGHNTRIEILYNQYAHIIEFDPPPQNCEIGRESYKRKGDETSPSRKKIKRSESDSQIMTEHDVVNSALKDTWEEIDNGDLYIFTSKGVKSSSKIAAFDMDGTLIKTKSGKVHPVDTNDWQLAFAAIPSKLAEQIKLGFKVVILSNQAPIGNGRVKIEDFKKKIESLVKELNVPIQVYIATGRGFYRKPMTGMWKTLSEKKNDALPIDMDISFYCGDAAGRLANWAPGKKKDHSMADRLLAENLGIKFFLPEQFFLGHPLKNLQMKQPDFVPMELKSEPFNDRLISKEKEQSVSMSIQCRSFAAAQDSCETYKTQHSQKSQVSFKVESMAAFLNRFQPDKQKVRVISYCTDRGNSLFSSHQTAMSSKRLILVFVGYPGSGKSFLSKQIENKSGFQYATVCRDILGSWQKCAAEATKLLERGKSVIVDSTNPDVESRSRWLSLAKQMKTDCRCVKMATTKEHAQHNNKFREIMKINHVPVNDIVFNMYKSKFTEPTVAEGFKEVIEVKLSPMFDDKEAEKIYKMYLLEK